MPGRGGPPRIIVNLTILAGAMLAAWGASRPAYHFEGAAPPGCFDPPSAPAHPVRQYRNPIAVAREWQDLLVAGECASQADLARALGVTRARVTQVLGLLELTPEVVEILVGLGDPLSTPVVTERSLRPLLKLPVEEQEPALTAIASLQLS